VKSVLIANKNQAEIERIGKAIVKNYNVIAVTSPEQMDGFLDKCDIIILDHNFTENSGIDFLTSVMSRAYIPVLIVTPPNDSKSAIKALKTGAHNYLVKTDNYCEILETSIKEALDKFDEREGLKETIITLKNRVAELEECLRAYKEEGTKQLPEVKPPSLIDKITAQFKRGEINLPVYPKINTKFTELIRQGARVATISELLRSDMGISSRLISISNSPYYRGVTENKTLEQAVSRLGLNETKKHVSILSNRALYTTNNSKFFTLFENLWSHSLSCAHAAEFLSMNLQSDKQDEVFTMGLLHDIGKLVLLQIIAELESGGELEEGMDRNELTNILKEYHGNFGAALFKKWRFPESYINISQYHDKLEEAETITRELLMVNMANLIVKNLGFGQTHPLNVVLEQTGSFRLLKLTDTLITDTKKYVKNMMQNASLAYN
jgi:putative nucleotidyltransferase with HDIG domain